MPPTKNALLRYAAIDACLRRPNRRWTFAALRKAVADAVNEQLGISTGVSVRTLRADLKEMRPGGATGYEAPIEYATERGYYYDPADYSIFNSPLSLDDLGVLQQALATLRQLRGLSLTGELDELVGRLEQRVSAAAPALEAAPCIQFEQVPAYAGLPWLGPLYRAIRARQAQWLTYQPFGTPTPADAAPALVHPHLLKQYQGRWFLLGHAPATGRPATLYALDRIRHLAPASDISYLLSAMRPETYFANLIGVSVPATTVVERVRLRFSAARLPYVLTKPLHASQVVVEEAGGQVVQLTLIPTRELRTLLLSFGADVEVLAPPTLRAEMAAALRVAAGVYDKE